MPFSSWFLHTVTVAVTLLLNSQDFPPFLFCPQKGISTFNPSVSFDLCFILTGNWNLLIKFWGCNDEAKHLIVSFSLHRLRLHVFEWAIVNFSRSINWTWFNKQWTAGDAILKINHNRLNTAYYQTLFTRSLHFLRQYCSFVCSGYKRFSLNKQTNATKTTFF